MPIISPEDLPRHRLQDWNDYGLVWIFCFGGKTVSFTSSVTHFGWTLWPHLKPTSYCQSLRMSHCRHLPPHSTHKLQPLDKKFMAPLRHYYGEKKKRWRLQNERAVTHYEVYERFGNEYLEVSTGNISCGFRATGHCPLNRNSFGDFDFDATIE